jgi:hypothetical protein
VNERRRGNAGLDRFCIANLGADRRDENDEEVENVCVFGQGGLRVRVLGRHRRAGHRPCVRKRDAQTWHPHTQEQPCPYFDRLEVVRVVEQKERNG